MSVTQKTVHNQRQVPAGITRPESYSNGEPGKTATWKWFKYFVLNMCWTVYGGVNDPRMGNTFEKDHPGYFGHIELNRPVYHVGFLKYVSSGLFYPLRGVPAIWAVV